MVAPSPPLPTPPRRSWAFYALIAAILLALPAGYFLFLSRSDPLPEPEPVAATEPEPEKKMEVRIASMEGHVEVRHPDGTWATAKTGDAVAGTSAVRTRDAAVAVLAGGEAWEVRMEAGTEVSVDELTESISRILLANGMATATVHSAAKHAFEVRGAGSDAVAKTTAGTFAISNNGGGT